MKTDNTINPHQTLAQSAFAIFDTVSSWAGKCSAGTARFIRLMQLGRMESVLHAMSNEQLKEIGIARRDIAKYAQTLIMSS